MRAGSVLLVASLALAGGLLRETINSVQAEAPFVALAGQVTSAAEGPMEGVLVSAQKPGSPITVTVVTDGQGRFGFPSKRLEPGEYALRIRAVGYELVGPHKAVVGAKATATVDLKLGKT